MIWQVLNSLEASDTRNRSEITGSHLTVFSKPCKVPVLLHLVSKAHLRLFYLD